MSQPPRKSYLRDLVANKRRYSAPPNRDHVMLGFRGWHERGYLPHYDAPGLTQLVMFRLADSLPASRRAEWEALLKIEDERERGTRLEEYLDRGHGACHLRRPDVAGLVENALLFFHGDRYEMRAWVVMPNHVHALVKVNQVSMSDILESWKSYTAKEANKLLGRQGRFWQPDYWDTHTRDEEQERKSIRYIENNPTKAHLVREPREWPWSSARFRDEYERLVLPPRSAAVPAAADTKQEDA